ncbi:MAG TPA: bifunctional proline dehydrogenase/L-glutamate gamma-semialdehyde dehydrogenase PutA [Gammaproteobacteria bacterium]|nr:bifunctional proline dehydrogenase/L-glutamate gamma-semialdehyde dehydrogenase PutA [Gammaproteobacteria bacterium]
MRLILSPELPGPADPLRARITAAWTRDETEAVAALLPQAESPPAERERILARAAELVARVRAKVSRRSAVDSFMREYDLSSEEGVLLMCMAEALLRIPDDATADKLIRDKLGDADWQKHLGASASLLVNASTWGLLLTGRLVGLAEATRRDAMSAFKRLVGRAGEPVIRLALRQAMRIMGHQFVMGRTIDAALARAAEHEHAAYRHSFDMLGEAALTRADAERYYAAYAEAIDALGRHGPWPDVLEAPSISVKLSALHPRYEVGQRARVHAELRPALLALAQRALRLGIGMTVDAEEAERLELSLDVLLAVFVDAELAGWNGFGLAVQAYQKRAPFVIDWLAGTAAESGRRWLVRLVKGAYWDAEIKRAQELGLAGYPVYTRKANTDVAYLACAQRLFAAGAARLYPQFATHNAHTIAAIECLAAGRPFEFQRLHGMGADLYAEVLGSGARAAPCRVYAPVGSHEDLLPYLVRRLLENGANTSFVNRIADEKLPIRELIADPCDTVRASAGAPHPRIPLPRDLYGDARKNSSGVNLADDDELAALARALNMQRDPWQAAPRVPGSATAVPARPVRNPADRREILGHSRDADAATIDTALANAIAAQEAWEAVPVARRAAMIERAADLLEAQRGELVALCVREAGKTIPAALAEVREASDLCRYYAATARKLFGQAESLQGPTGEANRLCLRGRGVFVCISPWNFPLAIFTGQIAAALVAGNAAIAKPAEQTTLIGAAAVALLHAAGVPETVLQFVPCKGAELGKTLLTRPEVAGVCFTGSTATAWTINRTLAARDAPIAALIAETGGQNALIADSSALPEQLVKDALVSAFDSAGQRCSAARVLYVQDDIADKVIAMLAGALDELAVGDPALLSTDVGPVIDEAARNRLDAHAAQMDRAARLIGIAQRGPEVEHGTFFLPRVYEIPSLELLKQEVFGPVLHVLRWQAEALDGVIDAINATGYGLTLGVHSRIDATVEHIARRAKVGNLYVNRNQIGAVVGVQPFGGENLSGTGPKAGGPHYLLRFATERTLTINTAAAGGNASLLTLGE